MYVRTLMSSMPYTQLADSILLQLCTCITPMTTTAEFICPNIHLPCPAEEG